MKKFKRNCPKCRKPFYYASAFNLSVAKKGKHLCSSCCQKGKVMSQSFRDKMSKARKGKTYEEIYGKKIAIIEKKKRSDLHKGKTISKEQKLKQSKAMKGRTPWNKGIPCSEETKRKISASEKGKIIPIKSSKQGGKNRSGKKHYLYGKNLSEEIKRKISLGHRIYIIKRNKIYNEKGYQLCPNFNKNACTLIDSYGKKHGYKFKHAMNGGEYFIKELCYWVDGYDKKNNVVIEVDEPLHYINSKLRNKDKVRQKEITSLLKCKFVRLKIK
jgi:hypothetical protein